VLLSPLAEKVLRAVERAHWMTVKASIAGVAGMETETRMQRPTTTEMTQVREDITDYLLDGGAGGPGDEFAEGVRQTLGWVLGARACPDYRDSNDGSNLPAVARD
jgi:hypothetical protein